MVAHNRIRCLVISVPANNDRLASRGVLSRDILPWADPYVAGLIKKLQDEVREERRFQSLVRHRRATPVNPTDDAAEDDMLFAQ